jgi:ribonuclease J
MWAGYLETESGRRARDLLERHAVPLVTLHASGHATLRDLQILANVLGAKTVVPIHTAEPERYGELFAHAALREDGEWWPV